MTLCDICAAEGYPYDEETCKDCECNPNREEKIRMTDLISKRQMVEKIEDLFLDKYEAKANSDLTEFYKEVLKILINEEGQSDWISTKDRLPEPSEKVLTYGVRTVTHWMPLPEPPKENSNDDN